MGGLYPPEDVGGVGGEDVGGVGGEYVGGLYPPYDVGEDELFPPEGGLPPPEGGLLPPEGGLLPPEGELSTQAPSFFLYPVLQVITQASFAPYL